MKKTVLIVNPPSRPFTNSLLLAEPIDALQIATFLEQYTQVDFIDMNYKQQLELNLSEPTYVIFVYDYLIPLHTSETISNIYGIVSHLPKGSISILISRSAKHMEEEYKQHGIDILIHNNIAHNLLISLGITFPTATTCLVKPNRALLSDNYNPLKTIISSVGCCNKCKFCPTPWLNSEWTTRTVESILEEIDELYNLGTRQIVFLDDNFTVSKTRVLTLCKALIDKNYKDLRLGCLSSINTISMPLLNIMYRAGFRWIHFGIESGSKEVLTRLGKHLDLEYAKHIILYAKKKGFRVRTSFIVDFPDTTEKDIKLTSDFIAQTKPDEIRLHHFVYRYNTPLQDNSSMKDSQYIHSAPISSLLLEPLLQELSLLDYEITADDTDWRAYTNIDTHKKIASFNAIKYGLGW